MNEPRTIKDLRELLVERGRDPFEVLLPEDRDSKNPESRYVVEPRRDGRFEVRVSERGQVFFHEIYPDEASAVRAISARTPPLVVHPPSSPEVRARALEQVEAARRQRLARLQDRHRGST